MSAFRRFCSSIVPSSKKNSSSPSPSPSSSPTQSSPMFSHAEKESTGGQTGGEIERVFRYIDENGDGKISPAELQRCVKAVGIQRLTAEEAEAAVETSDSDGDGLLSLEEFKRLMGNDAVSEEEKTEELRGAFLMYIDEKEDAESGGCITPKSLRRMLSRLGESKSVHDCEVMIRMYDLNGDGVLSFDEFAAMMR